jgi:hypothetical protein
LAAINQLELINIYQKWVNVLELIIFCVIILLVHYLKFK